VGRDCSNSVCAHKTDNNGIEEGSCRVDKGFQQLFWRAIEIQFSITPSCWWVFHVVKKKETMVIHRKIA